MTCCRDDDDGPAVRHEEEDRPAGCAAGDQASGGSAGQNRIQEAGLSSLSSLLTMFTLQEEEEEEEEEREEAKKAERRQTQSFPTGLDITRSRKDRDPDTFIITELLGQEYRLRLQLS